MANTSLVQVRVEPEIKKRVEDLFHNIGLDIASAVRLFFMQSLEHNGIPFSIRRNSHSPTEIEHSEHSDLQGKYKKLYSTEKFLKQKHENKELEEWNRFTY